MIPDYPLREGTNGGIAGPLPCELARLDFKGVALKCHGPEALRGHRNQQGRGGKSYALGCSRGGEGSHEGRQGNVFLHEAILLPHHDPEPRWATLTCDTHP